MAQNFSTLLKEIKTRIHEAQTRAILSVNSELIRLYWDIGRIIDERQKKEGWGASVIPRLAKELSGQLYEIKGFSVRNLGRMIAFYRVYSDISPILPTVLAKLDQGQLADKNNIFWMITWSHHILLMDKIDNQKIRFWYMKQIVKNNWSYRTLLDQIKTNAHTRQGKAITNFKNSLPEKQSLLAEETLKDPYIFDFLTLQDTFHERELGDNEYYIDLLFYHLKLRSLIEPLKFDHLNPSSELSLEETTDKLLEHYMKNYSVTREGYLLRIHRHPFLKQDFFQIAFGWHRFLVI